MLPRPAALFTMMSMAPHVSIAVLTSSSATSGFETSPKKGMASPPSALMISAVDSASPARDTIFFQSSSGISALLYLFRLPEPFFLLFVITFAPSLASPTAMPFPIPCPDPVTTATFPSSDLLISLPPIIFLLRNLDHICYSPCILDGMVYHALVITAVPHLCIADEISLHLFS